MNVVQREVGWKKWLAQDVEPEAPSTRDLPCPVYTISHKHTVLSHINSFGKLC
jgi:hypothetical protein